MIYGYLIVQSARHSLNFSMARKTLSFSLFHSLSAAALTSFIIYHLLIH